MQNSRPGVYMDGRKWRGLAARQVCVCVYVRVSVEEEMRVNQSFFASEVNVLIVARVQLLLVVEIFLSG